MVLSRGDPAPREHVATSADIFLAVIWSGVRAHHGHQQAEARDAAEYPPMHRTAPHNKDLPG